MTDSIGERSHTHVANIIVENLIIQSCGNLIVRSEVCSLNDGVVEVEWKILEVAPVAGIVEGSDKVDMSVFQFRQHITHHFE